MADVGYWSAREVAHAIATKQLSSREVLEELLAASTSSTDRSIRS
jgi:hypothetical protein